MYELHQVRAGLRLPRTRPRFSLAVETYGNQGEDGVTGEGP